MSSKIVEWVERSDTHHYIPVMELKDGSSVVARLTTTGRKTGLPRTVELRFLYYQGSFYATSSRLTGKHWCQNMVKNPAVEIAVRGEKFSCIAAQVTDETLRKKILAIRGDSLDRVVFEIKPVE